MGEMASGISVRQDSESRGLNCHDDEEDVETYITS